VGNRRKRALLKHFGSLKRVREASVEELRQVSGISPILAEEIVRFFKECDSFLKKKYAASQKES
jgi:excinuclease ABC subunit C